MGQLMRQEVESARWGGRDDNVVERAIAIAGGRPIDLAERMAKRLGKEISRQVVNGWRARGVFPVEIIAAVHEEVGIPLEELVLARPRLRTRGSPVVRAIAAAGGSAAKFSELMTKRFGRSVTRQMVGHWLVRGKFPRQYVLDVHLLTKIPLRDLLEAGVR